MSNKSLLPYRSEDYNVYAASDLSPEDLQILDKYHTEGGHPLAPATAAKLFELFLNGSDAHEIQRLNKGYPLGSVLDSQVRYKWTEKRSKYADELQNSVFEKVKKAQLETTDLMADLLVAARKKYGDKLKKFIQTGDEKDLEGVLNIESLNGLMKITEGLLKVTGQDRIIKTKNENTQTFNVNMNQNSASSNLTSEEAAQILSIMSTAKGRKSED